MEWRSYQGFKVSILIQDFLKLLGVFCLNFNVVSMLILACIHTLLFTMCYLPHFECLLMLLSYVLASSTVAFIVFVITVEHSRL